MPETIKFISRSVNHIIYVGDKKVVFSNGEFSTSDEEIIKGLREKPYFDSMITEFKIPTPVPEKIVEIPVEVVEVPEVPLAEIPKEITEVPKEVPEKIVEIPEISEKTGEVPKKVVKKSFWGSHKKTGKGKK